MVFVVNRRDQTTEHVKGGFPGAVSFPARRDAGHQTKSGNIVVLARVAAAARFRLIKRRVGGGHQGGAGAFSRAAGCGRRRGGHAAAKTKGQA